MDARQRFKKAWHTARKSRHAFVLHNWDVEKFIYQDLADYIPRELLIALEIDRRNRLTIFRGWVNKYRYHRFCSRQAKVESVQRTNETGERVQVPRSKAAQLPLLDI